MPEKRCGAWTADLRFDLADFIGKTSLYFVIHNKPLCRAARGTTTDESQDCSVLRSLRCRSGRCLTSGLRFTSVVAGRVVYTPFRSVLDKRRWCLATPARSNTGA